MLCTELSNYLNCSIVLTIIRKCPYFYSVTVQNSRICERNLVWSHIVYLVAFYFQIYYKTISLLLNEIQGGGQWLNDMRYAIWKHCVQDQIWFICFPVDVSVYLIYNSYGFECNELLQLFYFLHSHFHHILQFCYYQTTISELLVIFYCGIFSVHIQLRIKLDINFD